MNSKVPITKDPVAYVPDPFWVTSSFSTGELNGKHVRIEWAREGKVLDWGIYRIEMGSYGHSRHIQSIHTVLVEGTGGGMVEFDFDQADADLLHRSNENPKKYGLVARLDCDRLREQNFHLETLVRERRMRKTRDVEGTDDWRTVVTPVLSVARIPTESYPLPDVPGDGL